MPGAAIDVEIEIEDQETDEPAPELRPAPMLSLPQPIGPPVSAYIGNRRQRRAQKARETRKGQPRRR